MLQLSVNSDCSGQCYSAAQDSFRFVQYSCIGPTYSRIQSAVISVAFTTTAQVGGIGLIQEVYWH